jgi:predicted small secreted protein
MTFISIRPDFLSATRFLRSLALVNSLLMALALTACANFYAGAGAISDMPDLQNPPRLYRANGTNQLEWDRPAAFGRVPSHLQARGNTICGILGQDVVALGYNPNALDQNGKQIPGGGYFCGRA